MKIFSINALPLISEIREEIRDVIFCIGAVILRLDAFITKLLPLMLAIGGLYLLFTGELLIGGLAVGYVVAMQIKSWIDEKIDQLTKKGV